jgi:MFS family permease
MGDDEAWRRTFWLVCVSTLGNFTAQGLLYPALPLYLTNELGTSKAVAGLVVSVMAVSALVVRPWSGAFLDRRGRKALLVAGPALVACTAVGLLVFRSVAAVFLLRLVQGAGSAMTYSAAGAAVADVAPEAQRGKLLALFSLFFYIGFAVGPFVAETLIDTSGFVGVWWAVGLFSVFGAATGLAVPETGTPNPAARPVPWRARLFHPVTRAPGAVFFCIGVGWTAVASFLSLYARDIGLGSSDGLFAALALTVIATRFFAGGLADRFGRLQVALPSVLLVVVGLVLLAAWRTPVVAVVGLVVFGTGFSGAFPALFTIVVDRAAPEERGTAMSSFNVYYDLGAPLGGYGVGQLVDWGGFGLGFGAVAALAFVGALLLPIVGRSPDARAQPLRSASSTAALR